jgi:MFS transporter, DHA1 family, multidrug resistance protein
MSSTDSIPTAPAADVEKPSMPLYPNSVVQWDGPDDLENPHNWSTKYKFFVSGTLVVLPLIVNIGTSILSGTAADLEEEFQISTEVVILSTTTTFLIVCLNSYVSFSRCSL